MTIIRRSSIKPFFVALTLLFAYILIGVQASAAWVRGISSNFDLHNFTEMEVNNLQLTLSGIGANDIVRLYAGDGARGWTPALAEGGEELVTIIWRAPGGTYLKPCKWLHLGLSLRAGAPPVTQAAATWSSDVKPGGPVAFVWQNWDADPEGVVNTIIPPSAFPMVPGTEKPDPLIVERRVAFSEALIPLNNLTQEEIVWSHVLHVDTLTPDSPPSEMTIPWPSDGEGAVLVQYTVALDSTHEVEAVFTNQARIVLDPGPRPQIVKPVDYLGERPDMVYEVVNLWATEATGLWDDRIVLARFDYSTDGGQCWHLIGEDDDGTATTFSTTENTYQHNWWHVKWDLSPYKWEYQEGWYLVRATMIDREENIGEDVIEVYFDPTPPIPQLEGLEDHTVFLGPREISCATLDEDIASVVWEVQPKLLYYTKGIPHLDQHDYGVGQANNGNMYCAPTGSAACLKWWSDHGYTKLTEDLDGNPLTDTGLVEGLADAMGTSSISGTSGAGIFAGLRQWITDRGLLLTVTEHATINPTTIRNELENCKEDVILGILWNTGGGHIVTANSIANFTNADGTTDIDVMNPWVGGIVDITMEPNGDVHWPGKNGVQDAALMATVSPIRVQMARIPWIPIGEELTIQWDPTQFKPGLYLLRATMTDRMGNQCSSQIVARVGQRHLPVVLRDVSITAEGRFSLAWQETEPDFKYAYTIEYCENLAEGIWREAELDGLWPIPEKFWSESDIAGLKRRFYRVMKDYEPK